MSHERKTPMPPEDMLTGLANFWYKLVAVGFFSFLTGVTVLIWMMVRSGTVGSTAYIFLVFTAIVSLLTMIWLNGIRRRAPWRIQEFLFRIGLYDRSPRE